MSLFCAALSPIPLVLPQALWYELARELALINFLIARGKLGL
jgi:hypothetical protein